MTERKRNVGLITGMILGWLSLLCPLDLLLIFLLVGGFMGGDTHPERFSYIILAHLALAIGSTIAVKKCRSKVRKAIVSCMVVMLVINLLLVNYVLGSAYSLGQNLFKGVVVIFNLVSMFLVVKCGWRNTVDEMPKSIEASEVLS